MARFFVITGMPRCATSWLAHSLNLHVDGCVVHEAYWQQRWKASYCEWKNNPDPIVGTVNWFAQFHVDHVDNDIHPQWGVVLRNPADLVRSYATMRHGTAYTMNLIKPLSQGGQTDTIIKAVSAQVFGQLEVLFCKMSSLGISPSVWYMDHYTTLEGFCQLAKHFGLDFEGNVRLPQPIFVSPQARRSLVGEPREWKDNLYNYVYDTVDSMKHVKLAYDEALYKMGTDLGEVRKAGLE